MLREPLIEEVNELRAVSSRASSQEGSNSSFSGEDSPFSFSSLFSLRGLELMAALTGCHFGAFSLVVPHVLLVGVGSAPATRAVTPGSRFPSDLQRSASPRVEAGGVFAHHSLSKG